MGGALRRGEGPAPLRPAKPPPAQRPGRGRPRADTALPGCALPPGHQVRTPGKAWPRARGRSLRRGTLPAQSPPPGVCSCASALRTPSPHTGTRVCACVSATHAPSPVSCVLALGPRREPALQLNAAPFSGKTRHDCFRNFPSGFATAHGATQKNAERTELAAHTDAPLVRSWPLRLAAGAISRIGAPLAPPTGRAHLAPMTVLP